MREFLQWTEAAAALNTDSEGLRQGLAFGLWKTLRAYLRADERAFLATLDSDGIALAEKAGGRGPRISPWDSYDPIYLEDGRTLDAWCIHDDLCHCEKQNTSQSVTGHPAVYLLHGFVCVEPRSIKRAADAGHFGGIGVSLPSWWGESSPVPLTETGTPKVTFTLLDRGETLDFRPPPHDLHELWFRAEDVERAQIQQRQIQMRQLKTPNESMDKPLDPRREKNLLRIIRALDVIANLPERGAAKHILKKLHLLGFTNTPDVAMIRNTLKDARALNPDSKPQ